MTRTSRADLRKREIRLLQHVFLATKTDSRGLEETANSLADLLGVSRVCVSFTIKSLVAEGYLEVIERFLDNGGRRENEYRITREGVLYLASATQSAL